MKTETRKCQNCKKDFTIETDDFSFYEKIKVPSPTFCPECRLVRRLSYRNERYLYKRSCDLCKKEKLSIYNSNVSKTVFCPKCWWSDDWEQLENGMEYDFSKPFFEQYKELWEKSPVQSLFLNYATIVDSNYNNLAGYLRECYMVFHADHNERCLYASGLKDSKDSTDALMLQKSELCYECVNVIRSYKNLYCVDCEECSDIYFSKNCVNCSDCIGCVNLRNKNHCIFNEQYTKEQYEEKLKDLNLANHENLIKIYEQAKKLWVQYPQKYMHSRNNVNSSGDYIYNSKNALLSYEMFGAKDCKYCQFLSTKTSEDCYDCTEWGENLELAYETLLVGDGGSDVKFCIQANPNVREAEYCYGVANVAHVFGCIGIRNKEYCILNKQYTKEQYDDLIPKIKKHMIEMPYKDKEGKVYAYGEFFPVELSPFGYNESTAQEFFPLTEKKAKEQGYSWKDVGEKTYKETKSWKELPKTIKETNDNILDEIILCEAWDADSELASNHNCTKAFRILPKELQFYRRMNIPLPRKCPNSRHYERTQLRASLKLWHRQCMCDKETHTHKGKCLNEFETSFAPNHPEIIYCEKCYQQEVY